MEMSRLGRTGLTVSRICLGTMTFGEQADRAASNRIMDIAADAGVNFIDTANSYPLPPSPQNTGRSEEIVGDWLKGKRDRFVLATKGNNRIGPGANDGGNSRTHLVKALDDSLRRLGTDYVDLYYLHHPDPKTPIDEVIETLDDMRRAGKIRYAAASNILAWQLAYWTCWSTEHDRVRFSCVQPRYNMLYRAIESELVPAAIAADVALVVYNPLAAGVLTGRYKAGEKPAEGRFSFTGPSGERYRTRYYQEEMLRLVQELAGEIAHRGKSLTHVTVRWTLEQPGITCAIVGASKPEQIADSLKAFDVQLDDADRQACDSLWYRLPRRRPEEEM
jgi:aryl-alcohol dehydrogenase-like predicted oxidoreductase